MPRIRPRLLDRIRDAWSLNVRGPASEPQTTQRADVADPRLVLEELCSLPGVDPRDAVGEAISQLPEREKLVMTLFYYEEMSPRGIGEVLGLREAIVGQLHTKAILRMKNARLERDANEGTADA